MNLSADMIQFIRRLRRFPQIKNKEICIHLYLRKSAKSADMDLLLR